MNNKRDGRWAARLGLWMGALLVAGLLQACGGGQSGAAPDSPSAAASAPAREQATNVEGAPIYRFAKISTGAYFYTGSQEEADFIRANLPDFRYENVAFQQSAQAGGTPVFRFANLANGGYFYTASVAERDATIAGYPNMRYEGSTFSVAAEGNPAARPVYRLANLNNGAYLFTSDPAERDYAVSLGFWRYEGSTFSAVPAGTSTGPDPCEQTEPWRVVSGLGGCATCADGGPGAGSSGDSVGAGAAWSQVRNVRARAIKFDNTLLGEANVSDGAVSIYPGCYKGPYIIEFVALANAEYFDEAIETWRPIPPANARLRVAMPAYQPGKDISANPFTEAAYQYIVKQRGGQANLTAGDVLQGNELVRSEANTKLIGQAATSAAVPMLQGDRMVRAAVSPALLIEDITLLPTLINDTTGQGALDTSSRGRWAAQLAALVKAARSYSGNTLQNPALDFTNHLVKDMLDNGRINPETQVDKQAYGLDAPSRVQVAIEDTAQTWGTTGLQTQVTVVNPSGCTSSTINWTQSGNACSASVSGQYSHNASVTVLDASGTLRGSAEAVCSNGSWVATGSCSTAPLLSCAGTVLEWGTGSSRCSASAGTVPSGATVDLSDATGSTTGSATASCANGTWTVSGTCAVALGCPAQSSITWTQSGNQCDGALPQLESGGSVKVLDVAGVTIGSVTGRCNDGIWSLANEVCQPRQPISLDGGAGFSVAVLQDGTLWAWGQITEEDGPLIVANYGTVPVQIGSGYRSVSAGNHHVLALRSDGTLWAWGYNSRGQVGNNSTTYQATPVQIGSGFQTISAGHYHSLAIRTDGSLWAWGENFAGQLGNNATARSLVPIQIGTGYQSVSAGGAHSLALDTNGGLWAWGDNSYGQLGDSGCCDRWTPWLIGTGYTAIAAGGDHSIALRSDRSLWGWGANYSGQLGSDSLPNQSAPLQLGTNFRAVAAGGSHTLALGVTDNLWAWGYNFYGQVGNGSTAHRVTPVQIGTGYRTVAAGLSHSLAVRNDNTVWVWGANYNGQVGDGSTTNRSVPTQVTFTTGGELTSLKRAGVSPASRQQPAMVQRRRSAQSIKETP